MGKPLAKPELTFTLKSGRVMFLHAPLTAEERAAMEEPENMAILEGIADRIEQRAKTTLTPDDPEYHDMLRRHNIPEK